MNISKIFQITREQTWVNESSFSDTQLLDYLNLVYVDLVNSITTINENFFYDNYITNIVSEQNEYSLPDELKKILCVSIKYSTNDDFIKLQEKNFSSLNQDTQYYKSNQSKSGAFFVIADNSIFVYPCPEKDVLDWLKIDWISKVDNLLITSSEIDIKLPKEYHNILILWLKQYIYSGLWKDEKSYNSKQFYEQEKSKMLTELSDRNYSILQWEFVDLSVFE